MKAHLKLILSVVVALLAACSPNDGTKLVVSSQKALVSGSPPWTLTTTAADWDVVYDGYGSVVFDVSNGITMQPQAVSDPSNTSAALVLAKKTEASQTGSCPLQNFRLTIQGTTQQQLRTPTPNAWEVLWLFFNYNPVGAYKQTNYFSFKPSGVELGRAYDNVGQTYLLTKSTPAMTIGQTYTYIIDKQGQNLKAWIDGVQVMDYPNDPLSMDALYDVPGSIGLYTEDSKVNIKSITVEPLDPLGSNCLNTAGAGGVAGNAGSAGSSAGGGSSGSSGSGGTASGTGGSAGSGGSTGSATPTGSSQPSSSDEGGCNLLSF
ncbi:MAG: hypothetical protein HY073_02570 [Deltaproteobacteria bacterium]|nr:hypothetical protein [Deltaproteobacteria bacterium]